MTIASSTSFDQEDGRFNVSLSEFDLDYDTLSVDFDGVTDISKVITRNFNFWSRAIGKRLISVAKTAGPERLSDIYNTLSHLVPDEVAIPNTNLYVEGGICNKLTITKEKI